MRKPYDGGKFVDFGAGNRVRTRDPLITNQVLYQLSYAGGKLRLPLESCSGNGGSSRTRIVIAYGADEAAESPIA